MDSPAPEIKTIATHVLHGHQPVSQKAFALGPFEHLGNVFPISTVWVYKSSSHSLIPIEQLRAAICRLLDCYPHLAGRLAIASDNGARSIDQLDAGMHLIEARCDASFQSFSGVTSTPDAGWNVYEFPEFGQPLLPPWDVSPERHQRDPIFAIQRTQFDCSTVVIGIRVSHVVTAAGGFLRLYQDLAEIYRSISAGNTGDSIKLSKPPHLEPYMVSFMVHMSDEEKHDALRVLPAGHSIRPETTDEEQEARTTSQNYSTDPDPAEGRALRFSPEQLATLKRLATDPDDPQSRASSFTALAAHLWQRTHLARVAKARTSSEETNVYDMSMFGTSVDFCKHFDLPERAFSNTVITPVMELASDVMETAPLWDIAGAINNLVRHVSEDETRKLGKWVAAQPKKQQIQIDFKATPSAFIATSWHRFPLYSGAELDVVPIFASPVSKGLFDGMVVMVESRTMDGGIDVLFSVKKSTFVVLDADKSFIANWD